MVLRWWSDKERKDGGAIERGWCSDGGMIERGWC